MILGIYSDLHSNLPAMEALLSYGRQSVDMWLCAGDTVGLFPFINEVLDLQRSHKVLAVRGDHENFLLSGEIMPYSFSGNDALQRQRTIITTTNREYLEGLPEGIEVSIDGLRIKVVHNFNTNDASPVSNKYCLDQEKLDTQYGDFDYVFFGHTHYFTVLFGKACTFMNPGSLGFPVDAGVFPSALLLDTQSGKFEMLRLTVDCQSVKQAIQAQGYCMKLLQYLDNGYRWI